MFETAEVGNKLSKTEFRDFEPEIRTKLLAVQERLAVSPLSVVIIISGAEGAGKGELVNTLLEWMDARGIETHAIWASTDEEKQRPHMWRFWRILPPRGKLGIFFGSWYTIPIVERVFDDISEARFDQYIDEVVEFERMLNNENTLVLKFWMHLSTEAQEARIKQLLKSKKDSWRVSKLDQQFAKKADKFHSISERALRRTNRAIAPWYIIEATDKRYRVATITQIIHDSIEKKLAQVATLAQPPFPKENPEPKEFNIIRKLDYELTLDDEKYAKQKAKYRGKISRLTRDLRRQGKSMIVLFEGPDASGKGGAIRRMISGMDARSYKVVAVGAPTDEEKARPYLWRFWRHLPRQGQITIFDRSWYGRVLVERLEGFCSREDYMRAYQEINQFEQELTEFGIILVKFYLSITEAEQLDRFKDRVKTPYKQYKITEEDWRNRARWKAYEAAACDMIERTSAENWPWTLVEANNKNYARIKVMKTVAGAMKHALK